MSKLFLQIVNATVGLLTVVLAGMSLALGSKSPVYGGVDLPQLPALDSNLRFFGGMGLGLGLVLLWITPSIDRRTTVFRVVWLCTLLGGVGRLVSWASVGTPPVGMVAFTVIEVPLVPVLLLWQRSLAAKSRQASSQP